jgi:methylated-DNA-protein-cysteine methyltransferase related protein
MTFKQKVLYIISKIPAGNVLSYGQIASLAGSPRSARQVGWILFAKDGAGLKVPWWRVVNSKGYLSIHGNLEATKEDQKMLLMAEGVEINENFVLDIKKYSQKI